MASTLPLKTLAQVCRSLSTMLESGIEVRQVFKLAAKKTGNGRCRDAMVGIAEQIDAGNEVSTAMRAQGGAFPELMTDMVEMSEQTGALPEVLTHLAQHYENNLQLRRQFTSSIAWPMFQLVAAVLIIALLIVVIGMIGGDDKGPNLKSLLFGLSGVGGAIIWLTCTFGGAFLAWISYEVSLRLFAAKQILDPIWLRVPVLGNCLQSFAIARFSWAYYLTQQTGMTIDRSLMASLKATNNGAFQNAAPELIGRIHEGEDFSTAIAATGLFPEDYLHMVSVAETSGTVPETLYRLSPQFEDQARRSLKSLTTMLSGGIWLMVATFIVFFIFRFFMWYVGMINDAVRGV